MDKGMAGMDEAGEFLSAAGADFQGYGSGGAFKAAVAADAVGGLKGIDLIGLYVNRAIAQAQLAFRAFFPVKAGLQEADLIKQPVYGPQGAYRTAEGALAQHKKKDEGGKYADLYGE